MFAGSHDVRPDTEAMDHYSGKRSEWRSSCVEGLVQNMIRAIEIGKAVYNDRFGCAVEGESDDPKMMAFFHEPDSVQSGSN